VSISQAAAESRILNPSTTAKTDGLVDESYNGFSEGYNEHTGGETSALAPPESIESIEDVMKFGVFILRNYIFGCCSEYLST